MDSDWIKGIYSGIKQAREEKLARILDLLRPKAETDKEVKEAVQLLESWVRDSFDGESQTVQEDKDQVNLDS